MKVLHCVECGYDAYGKDENEAELILSMHEDQMHVGESVTSPVYNKIWLE